MNICPICNKTLQYPTTQRTDCGKHFSYFPPPSQLSGFFIVIDNIEFSFFEKYNLLKFNLNNKSYELYTHIDYNNIPKSIKTILNSLAFI